MAHHPLLKKKVSLEEAMFQNMFAESWFSLQSPQALTIALLWNPSCNGWILMHDAAAAVFLRVSLELLSPALCFCPFLSYNEFSLMREAWWAELSRLLLTTNVVFSSNARSLFLSETTIWVAGNDESALVCGYYCAIAYKETLYHPFFNKTNKQRTCKFSLCLCLQPVAHWILIGSNSSK